MSALASLRGPRARPLLVGVLDNPDASVRIAALSALRKVGGIDQMVVGRIERILVRASPEEEQLRSAAAAALADATDAARTASFELLKKRVSLSRGLFSFVRGGSDPEENGVVLLALARSLVAIGGPEGKKIVAERAAKAPDPIGSQLDNLLAVPDDLRPTIRKN
jgi:hypothetical protein